MPLVLIRHLSRFQQDLKATIFEDSFDNSNAQVAKSGSLRRRVLLRFPVGKFRRLGGGFTTGNSCPANSSPDSKLESPRLSFVRKVSLA